VKRETDPASGVKERGRARRVDEEGEGGGEEWRRCSGRGGAPALSRRGRGAALKGESEGGGAVYCARERVFGGRGGRIRVWIFLCVHIFFRAFLKNRHNKLYFSVSDDFFYVYIVTHRKIIQFFCGFSYFSVGIFWNRQKNHNFYVRVEKNAQKNSSPTEKSEIPVVCQDIAL